MEPPSIIMENIERIPPPVKSTTDSNSVHMSYIRRDIDQININMQKGFERIDRKIDSLNNTFVTQKDFEEHMKMSKDHEDRIRILEEKGWKTAGAAGMVAGIISIFGVFLIQFIIK